MKTTIARHLIQQYTRESNIIVDPFCGSGVVPLEAVLAKRSVVAGDINPYGELLTRAKLFAPPTERAALRRLARCWAKAERKVQSQDLRRVPAWVRRFFHPDTLREALALRDAVFSDDEPFLFACLLGILHHQRPGFLSYPSSHLVPYLRDRKFPRAGFPDLYEKRDVLSRMIRKVSRSYRRPAHYTGTRRKLFLCDSAALPLPSRIDAVITSPPYMNELDYVRDNRLRLWLLRKRVHHAGEIPARERKLRFVGLLRRTLARMAVRMNQGSIIALVVGDVSRGGSEADSAQLVKEVFTRTPELEPFRIASLVEDSIPDIRRARRDLRGTKRETILVYERV